MLSFASDSQRADVDALVDTVTFAFVRGGYRMSLTEVADALGWSTRKVRTILDLYEVKKAVCVAKVGRGTQLLEPTAVHLSFLLGQTIGWLWDAGGNIHVRRDKHGRPLPPRKPLPRDENPWA